MFSLAQLSICTRLATLLNKHGMEAFLILFGLASSPFDRKSGFWPFEFAEIQFKIALFPSIMSRKTFSNDDNCLGGNMRLLASDAVVNPVSEKAALRSEPTSEGEF